MTAVIVILSFFLTIASIYFLIVRPWHLHWGARTKEILLPLPGDNIVLNPDFNATRAITIEAIPSDIWPWLIQIGSKRAGWYSIDWIDNAGVKSSEQILPEFQKIELGQFIPFTSDQKNGMWVRDFKQDEFILWCDRDGKATWLWFLIKADTMETRLLTRLRTQYNWKGVWILYYLLYDIGDIVLMRKCMQGIKERVEKRVRRTHNDKALNYTNANEE